MLPPRSAGISTFVSYRVENRSLQTEYSTQHPAKKVLGVTCAVPPTCRHGAPFTWSPSFSPYKPLPKNVLHYITWAPINEPDLAAQPPFSSSHQRTLYLCIRFHRSTPQNYFTIPLFSCRAPGDAIDSPQIQSWRSFYVECNATSASWAELSARRHRPFYLSGLHGAGNARQHHGQDQ